MIFGMRVTCDQGLESYRDEEEKKCSRVYASKGGYNRRL